MRWHPWLVLALMVAVGRATAQEALYGKQPPLGSAFLRFVNIAPRDIVVRRDGRADVTLSAAAADRVGRYFVVENAAKNPVGIAIDRSRFTVQAAPDSTITVVFGADRAGAITMTPIVDQTGFNQTRVRLAFYNLVEGCAAATLKLLPAGQPIFTRVQAGGTQSRAVAPVQASVQAVCDGIAEPTLLLGGLEIGTSYSIWFSKPGADATLVITKDAADRYDPDR